MVNPDALASLQAALGPQGDALAEQLLTVLRGALASAIADVFVVTTVITAAALIPTLLLKETPLRGYGPSVRTKSKAENLSPGDDS
jgi:hypothetical protein